MSDILSIEQVTPATPAATQHLMYPKSDGYYYTLNSAGLEVAVLDSRSLSMCTAQLDINMNLPGGL